jgi:hypothetical protein
MGHRAVCSLPNVASGRVSSIRARTVEKGDVVLETGDVAFLAFPVCSPPEANDDAKSAGRLDENTLKSVHIASTRLRGRSRHRYWRGE